ncbi:hypothetical protein C3943_25600 [Lysinibacillus sp. B2A1]|nr:hypothetical protein C3943_25600 [Lysinibacillus sp. B2A1]
MLDKKIIGTFCISEIEKTNEFSVEAKSKYLSQIAILPEFQGKNFGSSITQFACSFVKELKKTIYLDCWAGNEKLKEFYLRNGLEYIGDFPEEDYYNVFLNIAKKYIYRQRQIQTQICRGIFDN